MFSKNFSKNLYMKRHRQNKKKRKVSGLKIVNLYNINIKGFTKDKNINSLEIQDNSRIIKNIWEKRIICKLCNTNIINILNKDCGHSFFCRRYL